MTRSCVYAPVAFALHACAAVPPTPPNAAIPPPPGPESIVWNPDEVAAFENLTPVPLSGVEPELLAALYTHLIRYRHGRWPVICLSTDRDHSADPPSATIEAVRKAFGDRVEPVSRCTIGGWSESGVVRRRADGVRGIVLWVRSVACRPATRCTAKAGSYSSNTAGDGGDYGLERTPRGWRVTGHIVRAVA